MALDQLTLLVNKYRRLRDSEETNDEALDEAYEAIEDYLRNNNRRFIIKASAEVEYNTSEMEDYVWLVDSLVDERQTIDEAIAEDFKTGDCDLYISWEDIHLSLEDENGKELARLD